MQSQEKYTVIGVMSGTSLDGVDLACCSFFKKDNQWQFSIDQAITVAYNKTWIKLLTIAPQLSGSELAETDVKFGKYLGLLCDDFIKTHKLKPDFISSHGHTIFHQPAKGFTLQIGNGNAIYSMTGVPVVYDFRTLDVLFGGQGAPLVPIGDKLLFSEYDVCLNLGGIANLSTEIKNERIAYDIWFVNMALNFLSREAGKEFDKNGIMAEKGEVNSVLLRALTKVYNKLKNKRPSLGREIFESSIQPLLENKSISIEDRLRTMTESAALAIVNSIREIKPDAKVLCTGGGAFNSFLLSRMLDLAGDDLTLIVADEDIIKFKEALVFAFLGVLRIRDEVNCLKSVTHATQDSSSGILVGF